MGFLLLYWLTSCATLTVFGWPRVSKGFKARCSTKTVDVAPDPDIAMYSLDAAPMDGKKDSEDDDIERASARSTGRIAGEVPRAAAEKPEKKPKQEVLSPLIRTLMTSFARTFWTAGIFLLIGGKSKSHNLLPPYFTHIDIDFDGRHPHGVYSATHSQALDVPHARVLPQAVPGRGPSPTRRRIRARMGLRHLRHAGHDQLLLPTSSAEDDERRDADAQCCKPGPLSFGFILSVGFAWFSN